MCPLQTVDTPGADPPLSRRKPQKRTSFLPHMKPLISFLRKVAGPPLRFVAACYRETPAPVRVRILVMAVLLGCAAALLLPTGCASTQKGIAREQTYYRAGTNIVAEARSILPFVPAPVATPMEVILGLASAALGAWNMHQQGQLKKLRNGNGNGSPAKAGPASPQAAALLSAQPASTPLTGS